MQTTHEEQPTDHPTIHDGLTCEEVETERRRVVSRYLAIDKENRELKAQLADLSNATLFVAEYLRQKQDGSLHDDLVDARLAAEVQTYRRWSDRAKLEAAERQAADAERRVKERDQELKVTRVLLDRAHSRCESLIATVEKCCASTLSDGAKTEVPRDSTRPGCLVPAIALLCLIFMLLLMAPHPA